MNDITKFDFTGICVECETYEEELALMTEFDSRGFKFRSGNSPMDFMDCSFRDENVYQNTKLGIMSSTRVYQESKGNCENVYTFKELFGEV